MAEVLLQAKKLQISFLFNQQEVVAVDELDFTVAEGHTLCVVGESGCGKSVTANAILRLLPKETSRIRGQIFFQGQDLVSLPEEELRKVRAGKISIIFQDHATSLNPVHTIGRQMTEAIRAREKAAGRSIDSKTALAEGVGMLEKMGIPSPDWRMRQYPHELSGGMRQRILIGMALSKRPALLIADEPTTALDVTVQAQILDLMNHLRKTMNTALLFITHDMGVVAEIADFVLVMYAGQMVEYDYVGNLFQNPAHPYTEGLLRSIPQTDQETRRLYSIEGAVPDLEHMPSGCRFKDRCPVSRPLCAAPPPIVGLETKEVRCWQFTPEWGKET
jgi:peptide/nickel transport system ATP-binding protein/oligopeptide transport system ATP-binding protein